MVSGALTCRPRLPSGQQCSFAIPRTSRNHKYVAARSTSGFLKEPCWGTLCWLYPQEPSGDLNQQCDQETKVAADSRTEDRAQEGQEERQGRSMCRSLPTQAAQVVGKQLGGGEVYARGRHGGMGGAA